MWGRCCIRSGGGGVVGICDGEDAPWDGLKRDAPATFRGSGEEVFDDFGGFDAGEALVEALEFEGEAFVVDA